MGWSACNGGLPCLRLFDVNRRQMVPKLDVTLGLPVLYLTELIPVALGESMKFPGRGLHRTDARSMAEDLGLTRGVQSVNVPRDEAARTERVA